MEDYKRRWKSLIEILNIQKETCIELLNESTDTAQRSIYQKEIESYNAVITTMELMES